LAVKNLPAQILLGVPPVVETESPSSWISQLALSQGATLREVLICLNLPLGEDMDLVFARHNIEDVAAICGLDFAQFAFMRTMFGGLIQLDGQGLNYLLSDRGNPRYRFCPVCLHEQRTKHFPVHWRFKAWRWCPEHFCMMEDFCPHCGKPVVLPASMVTAGPNCQGVAYLDRCMACDALLSMGHAMVNGTLNDRILAPWEKMFLNNGRALLPAIYRREIWFAGRRFKFSAAAMRQIEKRGLLPHDQFTLEAREIARRRGIAASMEDAEAQTLDASLSNVGDGGLED
jgi:TniQ